MEKNGAAPAGEDEDVIESSQVPTLRENIRKHRVYYGECKMSKSLEPKPHKKGRKPKQQNNKTVSQCLRQEWKSPQTRKRKAAMDDEKQLDVEDYLKIPTQRDPDFGVDENPSVNLFAHQNDAIQRYMLSEITEAQQEEMLDKILQGFRLSYEEQQNVRPNSSPGLCEPPQAVVEVMNLTTPTRDFIPDRGSSRLTPDIALSPVLIMEQHRHVGEFPSQRPFACDEYPLGSSGCLDLSKKRNNFNQVSTAVRYAPHKRSKKNAPILQDAGDNGRSMEQDYELHYPHITTTQRDQRKGRTFESEQFCQQHQISQRKVSTMETATQTHRVKTFRNVGIQHRPVASLDLTKRNVITLARLVGSNPDVVYSHLDQVNRTAREPLWCHRNLSSVFTLNDPYYANLDYFMRPRFKASPKD